MNPPNEPQSCVHPPVVERLRIAVRERPVSDEELAATQVLLRADQDKLIAFAPNANDGLMYDFDYFYPQTARQEDVFRTIGLEMVDLVMGGLSANCIAIGFAETGKTHTLFGSADEASLIQETVRELFLRLREQSDAQEYTVGFSYWEMNCNGVHDNLSDAPVAASTAYGDADMYGKGDVSGCHTVYRDGLGRLYLSNLREAPVKNYEEFEALLNEGNVRRVQRGYARQFRWHGFAQLSLMTVDKQAGEQCVLRRLTFVHTKGPERVGANRVPKLILRQGSQVNVSSTLLSAAVIHSMEYRAKRVARCRTQAQLHDLIQRSESFFMECRYTQMMSQLMCGHEASFVLGCVDPLSYRETVDTLENLQLFRQLDAACVPVTMPSERGRLLRQLRMMEAAVGGEEVLQSIYNEANGRPRTEQEEALLALRGRVEGWDQTDSSLPKQGVPLSGQLSMSPDSAKTRKGEDSEGRSTRSIVYLNPAKTATYEGQWKNNLFDGFGEHVQSNFKYHGFFCAGRREGQGTLFLRESKDSPYHRVYEGEWLAGCRDGRGTQWLPDGEVYEGDFAGDERHGCGKLYSTNGDVVEGNFRHNKCEGWAVLRQAGGDWYEGYWTNGEREGPGVWHYVSRQRCLRGEWHHNKAVMGTMEDDAEKTDNTTGAFIPRLGLIDSDDILAKERARLTEKRRLEFAAAGKTWVDYAAMRHDSSGSNSTGSASAAGRGSPKGVAASPAANGNAVYGLEIE
ncbi:hypothetical protein ABB37_01076 [Leptomonas pyrrhocoris]|uniref:MORN repeat-containing protein 3 n=1 Tax=Leptomonas pyrrhocoris TaxID=157538 RepID=A0A0M9G8B0_LEPPY|nr:hypothetical protein ABB37_01076 [Leptomonas pyrrhocoris]XP_015662976.1 hypothetical protein ABB37_01076 [Leptomonas pyrrhocoris]KPA84536.1 hypothetical protein ABB37_01076 [Leptomonas pyrrhocoris]KPA84537.1 hypothetical protein ABB37_01076 [Leptomonas pyrrhocoris]|eukprot:XP_015662975.1 hypothetical protein ABB37_01076 [Leptomonas pyrrhocoris]